MGWDDRKRQAALTTPDNKRFEFDYEDVDRSRAENASVFKFAEKSGARIPRQSSGHDIYPLTAIFNGDNYDIIGEEFWQATKVPGEFFLEHPRFVGIKRVQLMTIRQRVAAKSADNETKFDMVLHETLPESLPSTALDATTQILNTGLELLGEAGDSYAGNVELDNALVVGELQVESTSFIDDVNSFFADIAAQEAALSAAFDAQFLSVSAAIDNMVDGPLEFANNAAIFVATPSRVAVDISTRITAYEDLFDNTIDRLSFAVDEVIDAAHNRGALAMLTSMGIISGMCQSAVSDASYLTRGDVLNISDRIVAINDRTIAMLDEYSDAFNDEADPADRRFEITEATNILNDLVSLTTGRLYDVAFTLKQERIIAFDTERDTVTLTHELYGYTDANFDFLVSTNKLKSDEMYFIPPYKEIVYYI